jgi:hypothetical protein
MRQHGVGEVLQRCRGKMDHSKAKRAVPEGERDGGTRGLWRVYRETGRERSLGRENKTGWGAFQGIRGSNIRYRFTIWYDLGPLTEENAELGGGGAEWGEELGLHLEHRHTWSVAGEVDGGDDAAVAGMDGDGDGAEADFELLVAEGVAVAADVAEGEAEFVGRGDGAWGVLRHDDAGEVGFELVLR